MAKKTSQEQNAGKRVAEKYPEPKRLSKLGEWMRDNPKRLGLVINDMRAVMK